MRTIKDQLLSFNGLSKEELIYSHKILSEKFDKIQELNNKLSSKVQDLSKQKDKKDEIISSLNNRIKLLTDKIGNQRNIINTPRSKEDKKSAHYARMEYDFLTERIREVLGNKILAELMLDPRNPRQFEEKDYHGIINGTKSKKHELITDYARKILGEPSPKEDQPTFQQIQESSSIEARIISLEARLSNLESKKTETSVTDLDSLIREYIPKMSTKFRSSDLSKLIQKNEMIHIDPRKISHFLHKAGYKSNSESYIKIWMK